MKTWNVKLQTKRGEIEDVKIGASNYINAVKNSRFLARMEKSKFISVKLIKATA